MATEMGYEQAYFFGVELGTKPPSPEFVQRLISLLQLDETEQREMHLALTKSRRRFVIPASASTEVYELFYEFSVNRPGF